MAVAPVSAPPTGAADGGPARDRISRATWAGSAIMAALVVVVPIATLAVSILTPSTDVWRQQWRTRLPDQIISTVVLMAGVGAVSVGLGVSLAWLVSAYRFPGRSVLGWALVLPLAMPAYILGFVTTSVFGVAGPLQGWWRDRFGQDAWFPEIRSMPGAVITMSLTLFPYVYLLARAALRDQATGAYSVARTLGASRTMASRRVVLPMLRPAIAAGGAVIVMETLTDFATVQYFNVDTVSAGVYRLWRGTYDRDAASELAVLVLVFALFAIGLERILRGRARFGQAGGNDAGIEPHRLSGWRAAAATASASSVVLLAFGAPVLRLITWAVDEQRGTRGTPLLDRYMEFLGNSLTLTATTIAVCLVVAIGVTNARRFANPRIVGVANRFTAVGYAVPGPVVAMGVLLVLVAVNGALEPLGLELPGVIATGSFLALAYAYSVRFLAPGLNAVESGLAQVPAEVTSSARTLGARPHVVTRRVHLPLSLASIATAGVLVGVDALKELPIALLLRPIGFDTLSVWTYNLASESRFEQAALPALTIIGVALVPVALLSRRLDRPVMP